MKGESTRFGTLFRRTLYLPAANRTEVCSFRDLVVALFHRRPFLPDLCQLLFGQIPVSLAHLGDFLLHLRNFLLGLGKRLHQLCKLRQGNLALLYQGTSPFGNGFHLFFPGLLQKSYLVVQVGNGQHLPGRALNNLNFFINALFDCCLELFEPGHNRHLLSVLRYHLPDTISSRLGQRGPFPSYQYLASPGVSTLAPEAVTIIPSAPHRSRSSSLSRPSATKSAVEKISASKAFPVITVTESNSAAG